MPKGWGRERVERTLRIPPALLARVDAFADEFGLTVNHAVLVLVALSIRDYEREKGVLESGEERFNVGRLRKAMEGLPDESFITNLQLFLKEETYG